MSDEPAADPAADGPELTVPDTEEGREQLVAELRELVVSAESFDELERVLPIIREVHDALVAEAPDDTIAALEVAVLAAWPLLQTGDAHAAEVNLHHTHGRAAELVEEFVGAAAGLGLGIGDGYPPVGVDRPIELQRLIRARRVQGIACNHLAVLYHTTSPNLEAALQLADEAIELRTGVPEDIYLRAQSMANRGQILLTAHRPEEARDTLGEAVALVRGIPGGPEIPEFASQVATYGRACLISGDWVAGEAAQREAVTLAGRAMPGGSLDYETSARDLALTLEYCGCVTQAEVLARQAVRIQRGPGRRPTGPAGGASELLLARLRWQAGDFEQALTAARRALNFADIWLGHILELGTDTERLTTATEHQGELDQLLSIAWDAPGDSAAAAVLDSVIRRKALLAAVSGAQRRHEALLTRPGVAELIAAADQIRSKLSGALVGGEGEDSAELVGELIQQLRDTELQLGIAQRLQFEDDPEPGEGAAHWSSAWLKSGQEVAGAVPTGAALVEIVRFCRQTAETPQGRGREEDCYLALVVPGGMAQPRLARLGPAVVIDALVDELTDQLQEQADRLDAGEEIDFLATAAAVTAEKLRVTAIDPILRLATDCTRLLVCTDGQLGRVPWQLLPFGTGLGYLADSWTVTYLTSARSLLEAPSPTSAQAFPVVVADPDYDAGAAEPGAASAFERLTASRDEGIAIAMLLGVAPLLDAAASEGAVSAVSGPPILHLATHGWYLDDDSDGADGTPGWTRHPRFALIGQAGSLGWGSRCGLVLSGFNARWSGADLPAELGDGLLTADEVLALNLAGTEVVSLSACETGRGHTMSVQGTFGLPRSFLLAGARSVLASQWQVPDDPTRLLMVTFYRRLLAGASRADALRFAQSAVRREHPHPNDWAGFVLIGDSTPLPAELLDRLLMESDDTLISIRTELAADLVEADRHAEAEPILSALVAAGHTDAIRMRVAALLAQDRPEEARTVLGAVADDPRAAGTLGLLLLAEDPSRALPLLAQALAAGVPEVAVALAGLYERGGDQAAADEALARGAAINDSSAIYALAERAAEAGDRATAVDLLTRAADAGSPDAARALVGIVPPDQRDHWLRTAVQLGDPHAAATLAATEFERGDLPAALAALLVAARAGSARSASDVGVLLAELGRAGSEAWWQVAADAGVVTAAERLADLYGSRGDGDGRLGCMRRATELGSERAADLLGHLLVERGDPATFAEAEPLLTAAHSRGDPDAAWALAQLTRAQGRDDVADQWVSQVPPDCGSAAVSRAEAALAAGDTDAAATLLLAGSASVAAVAMLGQLLYQHEHPEAADVLRVAVARGDEASAVPLAMLLCAAGRRDEAVEMLAAQPTTGEPGRLHAALTADVDRLTERAEHGHAHAAEDLIRRAALDGAYDEVLRWAPLGARRAMPELLLTIAQAAGQLGRLDEARRVFADVFAATGSVAAAELLDRLSGETDPEADPAPPLAERAMRDWARLQKAERTTDLDQRIATLRPFEHGDYLIGRAQLALSLLAAGDPDGLALAASVPHPACANAVADELREHYDARYVTVVADTDSDDSDADLTEADDTDADDTEAVHRWHSLQEIQEWMDRALELAAGL